MSNTTDDPADRAPETTTAPKADAAGRGLLNALDSLVTAQMREVETLRTIIAEERQQRDRWYAAAGQRQDELNEAHQVIEWLTRAVLLEKDDLPAHLQAPELVRKHVRIAKAQFKDALPPWPNFMEIEP